MKTLMLGILTLFAATTTSAAEAPDWARRSAKIAAFDQFVDWMRNGPYYTITKVTTSEIRQKSGDSMVRVRIYFNDSTGCKSRFLNSDCTPLKDLISCSHFLVDCYESI